MNTFSIIAIPFFALSVVLLTLGATRKNQASFIVGGVFMASCVVNVSLSAMRSGILVTLSCVTAWYALCEL